MHGPSVSEEDGRGQSKKRKSLGATQWPVYGGWVIEYLLGLVETVREVLGPIGLAGEDGEMGTANGVPAQLSGGCLGSGLGVHDSKD